MEMAYDTEVVSGVVRFGRALKSLDPASIQKRFPHPEMEKYFRTSLKSVNGLFQDVEKCEGAVDNTLLMRIEETAKSLWVLYDYLADQTELGTRARLSEAVMWAEAGHVERSIFLAGIADGKGLREPYKTQMSVLPANACLFRYRQVSEIDAWIRATLETRPEQKVFRLLQQHRMSLLQQMDFFACRAYLANSEHPFATYMYLVACLFYAEELERVGSAADAERRRCQALELVRALPEPDRGIHFMEAQYHVMNYDEFMTFETLRDRHEKIRYRLETLSARAKSLQKAGDVSKPKLSYNLIPYVTLGARATSIASIVLLSAPVYDIAAPIVVSAINDLINTVVAHIPGMDSARSVFLDTDVSSWLAHTGGLPDDAIAHLRSLHDAVTFAHTGGLPDAGPVPDLTELIRPGYWGGLPV